MIEGLTLTVHFGERDRAGDGFLADALAAIHARHGVRTAVVLRGVEGFGAKHRLRTDRLLSLSEDLPLLTVAADVPERIEAARADVERLAFDGLVTLERTAILDGAGRPEDVPDGEVKLVAYAGRHERVGRVPAHVAIVAALHDHGVAGASALLGVDGTLHGERRRARFLGANREVPVMVVAVGAAGRIAAALPAIAAMRERPLLTLERVEVCKRDGIGLRAPSPPAAPDPAGLGVWQRLTVYASEQSRRGGEPLHPQLVRALRAAGAAGATTLRGIWGYHGDHAPHGDSFTQLRRRVPLVTSVVDTPERTREWWAIVDDLTAATGLVTSEFVPAFRATGPGIADGGLRLAARPQRDAG